MTPEQKEAAWNAYQTFPIDMCADHDDEYRKAVIAAVEAALAASQPAPDAGIVEMAENFASSWYGAKADRTKSWIDMRDQAIALLSSQPAPTADTGRCSDCPPVGYPTDETRCAPCDRRAPAADTGEAMEPKPGTVWQRKREIVTVCASLGPGVAYVTESGRGEMTHVRFMQEYEPALPAPAVDTGQAVGFCAPETIEKLLSGKAVGAASISCVRGNVYTVPLYAHPAPLDAERVREAWAYRVHDCHIARSPVKARAKFPEATEHLYPASRHADAIEMARLLGGTCTPLYPPEDAR